MAEGIATLLGGGSRFEGKLGFDSPLRIDGVFRGLIQSDSVLVIGEGAEVEGQIAVATVIVRGGSLRGHVVARDAIEVYAPARVVGELHSPSVFLDKGVAFQGNCRMDAVGDGDIRALLEEYAGSTG